MKFFIPLDDSSPVNWNPGFGSMLGSNPFSAAAKSSIITRSIDSHFHFYKVLIWINEVYQNNLSHIHEEIIRLKSIIRYYSPINTIKYSILTVWVYKSSATASQEVLEARWGWTFFRFCWDNKHKTSEKYELYIRKKQDYYQVKTYMNHISNIFKNLGWSPQNLRRIEHYASSLKTTNHPLNELLNK